MANEIVPQPEAPNPYIDEAVVCQLKALARKMWPDEYRTRPKLTLIQGGKGVRHE